MTAPKHEARAVPGETAHRHGLHPRPAFVAPCHHGASEEIGLEKPRVWKCLCFPETATYPHALDTKWSETHGRKHLLLMPFTIKQKERILHQGTPSVYIQGLNHKLSLRYVSEVTRTMTNDRSSDTTLHVLKLQLKPAQWWVGATRNLELHVILSGHWGGWGGGHTTAWPRVMPRGLGFSQLNLTLTLVCTWEGDGGIPTHP